MVTPATAVTALATAVLVALPAGAQAERPEGKVVVFVTEGSTVSFVGTKLKEYDATTSCQALPPGAHVVINQSSQRLLFYADPSCLFPVPPPFNFINPGYGAHVSPTGGFRAG
jgi:hypothetical protein